MSDICISGAGLSGLTLGLALAQSGFSVCILDRQTATQLENFGSDTRTTAVSLTTQRLLENLGLWKEMAASATPITEMLVTSQGTQKLKFDPREVGYNLMGYIVPNSVFRQALYKTVVDHPRTRLCPVSSLTSFVQRKGSVTCTLNQAEEVKYRLLISCEGQHSLVTKRMAKAAFKRSYKQVAFVAQVELTKDHKGVAFQNFAQTGPLALLPLPDSNDGKPLASLIWSYNQDEAEALKSLDPESFIHLLNRRVGSDFPNVVKLTSDLKAFPLNAHFVEEVVSGNVLLLGEAAHSLHPLAGQGFNLTARDIGALIEELETARQIGKDLSDYETLMKYQRRRAADVAKMLTVVDGLNDLLSGKNVLPKPLQSLGFGLVDQLDPLRRKLIKEAMGISADLPAIMQI